MAKRRLSEIAKELKVPPKVIIDKCIAEGVPAETVKGHASVISAGLEASIREWFAEGAPSGTAIETTEHVDVAKVRVAPKTAKSRGKKTDSGDAQAATAVAEPPATETPARKLPPRTTKPSAPSQPDEPQGDASSTQPIVPPPERATPAKPPTQPHHSPHTPAVPPDNGGASLRPAAATPAAPAKPHPKPSTSPVRPPAKGPEVNVPRRPTVVAPAGPQLGQKQQVKLAGPKVVRIEAPEQIDVRAPRRVGPPGVSGPPRGGRGVIPGTPGPDEGDRSARRNKRRGPEPGTATPKRRTQTPDEDVPVGTGFSEADLAEREERLARASGLLKQRRREQKARQESAAATGRGGTASQASGRVTIAAPFTIKDLSAASGVKVSDIVKKLFMQGIMATANSGIDPARAQEIMIDFDLELEVTQAQTAEEVVSSKFEKREATDLRPRAPVVTIMGHVDHGKTSLLDAIRHTNVAAGEAGGITQKTSAFRVEVEVSGNRKPIVFFDTPGHEAFTEMRSRGATITDVVVLVVGAPEGVMPQTVESINHAKAAKVPIVVALNKIDSPQATEGQIQKIYGQLAEQGLNPVPWGGQTEVVKTSATKKIGIQDLLVTLDLQAQMLDLKADFAGAARGRVVESTLDEGRGAIATVLVQDGELKVGDHIVAGRAFGRVRDMTDDQGRRIKSAGPATPVQISGIDEVPDAGDPFFITDSLRKAEEAATQRRERDRAAALHQPKVTLDSLFSQMKDANVKEILIVLKADVQGSVDVIQAQIEKLSTDEVKVRVLHAAVGGINESDVLLAEASKAVIVGFNVIPSGKARTTADTKGVELRTYQVIYEIVEDVKKAASGMLEPEIRQEILGHAEVRKVFKVTKVGTIAGCYITDGTVQRDALIRVTRNGVVVENDRVLEQLKRFKDDAKDVRAGMECGMKIVGYDDIKEGDILECYKKVEVKRTL